MPSASSSRPFWLACMWLFAVAAPLRATTLPPAGDLVLYLDDPDQPVVLVYSAASAVDPTGWPAPPSDLRQALGLLTPLPSDLHGAPLNLALPLVDADDPRSPIDTLRMSTWERIFWGRRGLLRLTGLYPVHDDRPIDDLRTMSRVRRTMLLWHQRLGLATMASMAVTVVGGQIAINGGSPSLHEASLPFTIGLYSTTAAFALLSPPKLIHRDGGGWDTITFHKLFAVLHVAGMIATPLLAPERLDERQRHQILGYATFGAFSAGMLTVTLFK